MIELPEFSRCNAVMTMADSMLKRAHFISTHITVTKATRLFLYNIWKLHRLPQYIISDYKP